MNSSLGYINRTDIRRWETYASYLWKPPAGHAVMSYGPNLDGIVIYDHKGNLQNWWIDPGFTVGLARLTWLSFLYERSYELYKGQGFRANGAAVSATTSWFKWLDLSLSALTRFAAELLPVRWSKPVSRCRHQCIGNSDAASAVAPAPRRDLLLHAARDIGRIASCPIRCPAASSSRIT